MINGSSMNGDIIVRQPLRETASMRRRAPPPYHYYVANISRAAPPVVEANQATVSTDIHDSNAATSHNDALYKLPRLSLSRPRSPPPVDGMSRYGSSAPPAVQSENFDGVRPPRRQRGGGRKEYDEEENDCNPKFNCDPYRKSEVTTVQFRKIVEHISDEFRFLEERSEYRRGPSPASRIASNFNDMEENPVRERWSPIEGYCHRFYHKYVFVSLAVLQIMVAVGLLAFAVLRFRRTFHIFNRDNINIGSEDRTDPLRLLDFVKAEDYAASTREGAAVVAMKVGAGIFAPALLQLCAGLAALFPLYRRPPKYYMTINLIFSGFSIILWIEPIYLAALELNLRNVQINLLHESANYRLSVGVAAILSTDMLVAGSSLAIYSAAHLVSASRMPNGALDAHFNTIVLLAAFVCLTLSAYVTAVSMSHVAHWPSEAGRERRDLVALYGVGLKELIVSAYTLLGALFAVVATLLRRKSLRLGAAFTQTVSLFCVLNYLLNADRVTATVFNSQRMIDAQIAAPFSGVVLIILYAFIVIMAVALTVQLGTIIVSIFPFSPVTVYAAPLNLPFRSTINQNFQQQIPQMQTTIT